MTQEEKQLLVRDICARLPYGLKVLYDDSLICQLAGLVKVNGRTCFIAFGVAMPLEIDEIKPYLRSVASMTEDEMFDFHENGGLLNHHFKYEVELNILTMGAIDWLNKYHFDYRCLIEKGLAIEVTNENNPYKS